jgi:tetratricopeptide (TPR) repeat protein
MKNSISLALILIVLALGCSKADNFEGQSAASKTDEKIVFYSNKIELDPNTYANHNRLAQSYVEKARESGDAIYYLEAKEVLTESLRISPDNYVGIVYMAMANMAEHNFSKAREYAKQATYIYPGRSYAYGVLGDSYLELGELDKAEAAYNKMNELKPGLDSWSRISNLNVKRGNPQAAVLAMEKAYESGLKDVRTSKENLAWTQTMIGIIYLDNGAPDKAEPYFNKALEILPEYFLAIDHLKEAEFVKTQRHSHR